MGKLSLLDQRDVIEMTTADINLVVIDLCASAVCDNVSIHTQYTLLAQRTSQLTA